VRPLACVWEFLPRAPPDAPREPVRRGGARGLSGILSSVLLRAARRSPARTQPSRAEVPRVGPRPTPERRHTCRTSAGLLALSAVVITLLFFGFGVRVLASNDETRFPCWRATSRPAAIGCLAVERSDD